MITILTNSHFQIFAGISAAGAALALGLHHWLVGRLLRQLKDRPDIPFQAFAPQLVHPYQMRFRALAVLVALTVVGTCAFFQEMIAPPSGRPAQARKNVKPTRTMAAVQTASGDWISTVLGPAADALTDGGNDWVVFAYGVPFTFLSSLGLAFLLSLPAYRRARRQLKALKVAPARVAGPKLKPL